MGQHDIPQQSALTTNETPGEETQIVSAPVLVQRVFAFFEETTDATVMGLADGRILKKAMFGEMIGDTLFRYATISLPTDAHNVCLVPTRNFTLLSRSENGEIKNFMMKSHSKIVQSILGFTDDSVTSCLANYGIKVFSESDEESLCYFGTPSYSAPETIPRELTQLHEAAPPLGHSINVEEDPPTSLRQAAVESLNANASGDSSVAATATHTDDALDIESSASEEPSQKKRRQDCPMPAAVVGDQQPMNQTATSSSDIL